MPIPISSMNPPPPESQQSTPSSSSSSSPQPSKRERCRQLWRKFEPWATIRYQETLSTIDDALKEAEAQWRPPVQSAPRRRTARHNTITAAATAATTASTTAAPFSDLASFKARIKQSMEMKHYKEIKGEWATRLSKEGLTYEDWDPVGDEAEVAARVLGVDSIVVGKRSASTQEPDHRQQPPQPQQPPPPTLPPQSQPFFDGPTTPSGAHFYHHPQQQSYQQLNFPQSTPTLSNPLSSSSSSSIRDFETSSAGGATPLIPGVAGPTWAQQQQQQQQHPGIISQSISHQSLSSQSSSSQSSSVVPPSLSVASRSTNTSAASAGYVCVDPSQFFRYDDLDEHASPPPNPGFGYTDYRSSEDEEGVFGFSARHPQHQHPSLSSSSAAAAAAVTAAGGTGFGWNSSSNHGSLSSSPVELPKSSISGFASLHNHQLSSSTSSFFRPHVSTMTSASASALTSSTTNHPPAPAPAPPRPTLPTHPSTITTTRASTSTSNSKPKSKPTTPAYIGPSFDSSSYSSSPSSPSSSDIDTDSFFSSPITSEDEEDEDAAMAFETFKFQIRVHKIKEFHKRAESLDVQLAETIYSSRRATLYGGGGGLGNQQQNSYANGKTSGHYDKAFEVQQVREHERRMLELRDQMESERRRIVSEEKKRKRSEIEQRRAQRQWSGPTTNYVNGNSNATVPTTTTTSYSSSAAAAAAAAAGRKSGWTKTSTSTMTRPANGNRTVDNIGILSSSPFPSSNPSLSSLRLPDNSPVVVVADPSTGIDAFQSVLETAPNLGADTAWHISQLLSAEQQQKQQQRQQAFHSGGEEDYEEEEEEWGSTPHILQSSHHQHHRHTSSSSTATAFGVPERLRKESISILDEGRFATISAKNKRGFGNNNGISQLVTSGLNFHDTPSASFGAAATAPPAPWQKPPPSPEYSEALTDQYAQAFLEQHVGEEEEDDEEDEEEEEDDDDYGEVVPKSPWKAWGSGARVQSATNKGSGAGAKANNSNHTPDNSSSISINSAWGGNNRKPSSAFPPSKKTWVPGSFYDDDHQAASSPLQETPQRRDELQHREYEQHHQETPQWGSAPKKPSLLSGMLSMAKNAAMAATSASPTTPTAANGPQTGSARKPVTGAPSSTAPSNTPASPAPGKKLSKKQRQAASKKPSTKEDEEQESAKQQQDQHQHQQFQPSSPATPRMASAKAKFTSAFGGGMNSNSNVSGNPKTTAGAWDDIASTTPRPSTFGGLSGGVGNRMNPVRKPSGLHEQLWNSNDNDDGQDDGEDDNGDEENAYEEGSRMPGSLRNGLSGTMGGIFGGGFNAASKKPAANTHSDDWGWGSTPPQKEPVTTMKTNTNVKKSSLLNGAPKRTVVMEEVADESDEPWKRSPSSTLPTNSRTILEPKPSKPSEMFDNIISYAAESPEAVRASPFHSGMRRPNEGTTNSTKGWATNESKASAMPKGRTAASTTTTTTTESNNTNRRGAAAQNTSAPSASMDPPPGFNPEWFQRAAAQLVQATQQGEKLFGAASSINGNNANNTAIPTKNGWNSSTSSINIIPGREGAPNAYGNGLRSDNAWGGPSSFSSSMTGGAPMSSSFKDQSPLAAGPPPKMAHKSSTNTWGASTPSTLGSDIELGKAKPTIASSGKVGAGSSLGWGSASSFTGGGQEWGEPQSGFGDEKQQELRESKKRLEEMFGKPSGLNGPGKSGLSSMMEKGKANDNEAKTMERRRLQEMKEREEAAREREEAKKREEEQEKERKEKEAATARATAAARNVGKRGKGKRR